MIRFKIDLSKTPGVWIVKCADCTTSLESRIYDYTIEEGFSYIDCFILKIPFL